MFDGIEEKRNDVIPNTDAYRFPVDEVKNCCGHPFMGHEGMVLGSRLVSVVVGGKFILLLVYKSGMEWRTDELSVDTV